MKAVAVFAAVTSQLPVDVALGCTVLAVPGGTCLSYRVAVKRQLQNGSFVCLLDCCCFSFVLLSVYLFLSSLVFSF
jgi:hypothetical protein